MSSEPEKEVRQIGQHDDPGVPGGGKGRADLTGKSTWTPPKGLYPPGEGYEESGHSGVLPPQRPEKEEPDVKKP